MEKQRQLMRFFQIIDALQPHKRSTNKVTTRKNSNAQENTIESSQKKSDKDPLRMPPSVKRLLCILLEEQSINQRNIAKMMNLTAQAVSEILKKLERRELIVKENGEINNENLISLTPKGIEIATKISEQAKQRTEILFKDFTEEELDTLQKLMEKLYNNRIHLPIEKSK